MTNTRMAPTWLAALAAAALALAGPSCDCGGPGPGQDGGEDGGQDSGPPGPTKQVLEFHGGPSRSGLYVDPAMTKASVGDGGFKRDPAFAGGLTGQVYAQPLYFENTGAAPDLVIVATERNTVYAFDANDGGVVWQRALPQAMVSNQLPCGNISPTQGITGTPIIDPGTRTLYVGAMVGQDAGNQGSVVQAHQQVFALSLDDGSTRSGWPVDMNASAHAGATNFNSQWQGERGALALLGGKLYVPYGGMYGDCGQYHGWVVGISTTDPSSVTAWATRDTLSGIWAVSGLSSDGTSLFAATGNGTASTFGESESVLRFGAGPTYSMSNADRFTPSNWVNLDQADTDISGTGPIPVDAPGATPSRLIVQLGKDGNAYLLDRTNLGGDGAQLDKLQIASGAIIQGTATYTTPAATYFSAAASGLNCPGGTSGDLVTVKVTQASPPRLQMAWCARQNGRSSPIVTTTDGTHEAMVWTAGTSDGRLRAFDGDTGAVLFTSTDTMTGLRNFSAPLFAKGRVFIGADNRVYAYRH